jgi:CBS domain-containing protein
MATQVITFGEDASLPEIAAVLERRRIKRVPVVRDRKLVGIVSRANLIQALASSMAQAPEADDFDRAIRSEVLAKLEQQRWTDFGSRNIIVRDGSVHIWGLVGSDSERKALVALAEAVPGVKHVFDEMIPAY